MVHLPPAAAEATDFSADPAWHDVFYGEPEPARVADLARWLGANPDAPVRLFHGTSREWPVPREGLLPTTPVRRRRSAQSTPGYVYLSVYPGMAHSFGHMAYPYPRGGIVVYAVELPIRRLLPDPDQLRNQRHFAGRRGLGGTLAESLAYGHAARVRGPVPPGYVREIAAE